MLNIEQGYTFDDLLLIPKYSDVESRSDVDLSVDLGKGIKLDIPICSANMPTVTGTKMAQAIGNLGGLAVLHRFSNNRIEEFKSLMPVYRDRVALSIGVNESERDILASCILHKCKIVCIDVAHGHHISVIEMVEYIKKTYPHILLIAGNVATVDGAKSLYKAGADVLKLNIGNGSLCSTRIETGNGVPTLTAISNIHAWRTSNNINVKLICDGGMRSAGDIVKALVFTDAVMLGNLLAGTNEAPGEVVMKDGIKYKTYVGNSTYKANHIEGVAGLVPTKGPVKDVIMKLTDGIKSGCSYQGATNLTYLKDNPKFVSISNAGLTESHPHSVVL